MQIERTLLNSNTFRYLVAQCEKLLFKIQKVNNTQDEIRVVGKNNCLSLIKIEQNERTSYCLRRNDT